MKFDPKRFQSGYQGKFVIHDHRAKRHHYDLRLEVPVLDVGKSLSKYQKRRTDGTSEPQTKSDKVVPGRGTVLMSFSIPKAKIPKGESKVLAVETEPHPLSYATFEGDIPKGEYGAGTVKLFDSGGYKLVDSGPKKLVLDFRGNKLRGTYVLVNTEGGNWIFFKGTHKESRRVFGQANAPIRLSRNNYTASFDGTRLTIYENGSVLDTMNKEQMPEEVSTALFASENEQDKIKVLEQLIAEYSSKEKKEAREFISQLREFSAFLRTASLLDFARPGLDTDVWDADGNLRKRHQKAILGHLTKTLERYRLYNYGKWIKQILIVGSMTSYQYHLRSDFDVHIYVDVPEFINSELGGEGTPEKVEEILTEVSIEASINDPINLKGTKHPVEYYFELDDFNEKEVGDGAWDVVNEEWVVPPRTIEPEFDPTVAFKDVITEIEEAAKGLDVELGKLRRQTIDAELLSEAVGAFPPAKRVELRKRLDTRLEGLEKDIELLTRKTEKFKEERKKEYDPTSVGNLQFKYLQRFGFISILKALEAIIEDEEVTEDELEQIRDILKQE